MKKLIAAVALLAIATSAHAQVLNGGFEDPTFGIPGFIPNWTKTGSVGDVRSGNYFGMNPAEGSQFVGTVSSYGGFNGYYYQQIALPAGSYTLKAKGIGADNSGFVWIDGTPSTYGDTRVGLAIDTTGGINYAGANFASAPVATGQKWGDLSLDFTTAGGITTVFLYANAPFAFAGNWAAFDAVEIVPEPSSILAMASGLAGMAGMMIRRRK